MSYELNEELNKAHRDIQHLDMVQETLDKGLITSEAHLRQTELFVGAIGADNGITEGPIAATREGYLKTFIPLIRTVANARIAKVRTEMLQSGALDSGWADNTYLSPVDDVRCGDPS